MFQLLKNTVKGISLWFAHDIVVPWYQKNYGTVVDVVQLSIRNEIARKCAEALAKTLWSCREFESTLENSFLVTNVAPVVENGEYVLYVSVLARQADGAEVRQLPLHVFFQLFEPIGELTAQDYDA